jgi:hypothetical protein
VWTQIHAPIMFRAIRTPTTGTPMQRDAQAAEHRRHTGHAAAAEVVLELGVRQLVRAGDVWRTRHVLVRAVMLAPAGPDCKYLRPA